MRIVVQKYGGSSVGTMEKIRQVAQRTIAAKKRGLLPVIVVSAMGKTTDDLLDLSAELAPYPSPRELDRLLSVGEQVSISILAMMIRKLGAEAVSLTGDQAGIVTDDNHNKAKILEIRPQRILDELDQENIVIIAGFQGRSRKGELTTLGRGGSDTSAVALAAALNAERCEINTDVDGIYEVDPRLIAKANLRHSISYREMLEFARLGASILHAEAVRMGRDHQVRLMVRSSFSNAAGTEVIAGHSGSAAIVGLSRRKDIFHIVVKDFDQRRHGDLLRELGKHELLAFTADGGRLDALVVGENFLDLDGFLDESVTVSPRLGAVSLIGNGLGNRTEIFLHCHALFADLDPAVERVITRADSMTFVIARHLLDEAIPRLYIALKNRGWMGEHTHLPSEPTAFPEPEETPTDSYQSLAAHALSTATAPG